MEILWTLPPVRVASGAELQVKATTEGVIDSYTLDGDHVVETMLTEEETMQHADNLTRAATFLLDRSRRS